MFGIIVNIDRRKMHYKKAFQKAYDLVSNLEDRGRVASYIPELAKVDGKMFGVHISTLEGENFGLGDFSTELSIQSIAKVLAVSLAYKLEGEKIWKRLGVEPSGTSFNSLLQLESDNGIPRNPLINAGALVVVDILLGRLESPKEDLLAFIQGLSPNRDIDFSKKIATSEKLCGHRNVALCNYLKSLGNLVHEPEDVLNLYFDLCSLQTSCEHLSELFLFLANKGKTAHDNNQVLTGSKSKRINALMQTCGFYDESGEFAFKVGLAGKSGVGGGIIAVYPGQYAIAVWSPKLNEKGNSYKGMRFLEEFTTLTENSIF